MATNALIRYGKNFLFLFGIVQSFADPITDILTLVEFYRADHKTWFRVGLCFVILPCIFLHSFTWHTVVKTVAVVGVHMYSHLVALS